MERSLCFLRTQILHVVTAGILMAGIAVAHTSEESLPTRCWQLTPLEDRLVWTPQRDHMTPYVWVGENDYRFEGETALLGGPGVQEWTVFAAANTTQLFSGAADLMLTVTWPDGHQRRGEWTITAGQGNLFTARGLLEPMACQGEWW